MKKKTNFDKLIESTLTILAFPFIFLSTPIIFIVALVCFCATLFEEAEDDSSMELGIVIVSGVLGVCVFGGIYEQCGLIYAVLSQVISAPIAFALIYITMKQDDLN